MARRPLRQLLKEARESEQGRRDRPDERTKSALFHFNDGELKIQYDFPTSEGFEPGPERRGQYLRHLAELSLDCVRHTLAQDRVGATHSVVFDGRVKTIDLSTGQEIEPTLIRFAVSRSYFAELDLNQVDPVACLRAMDADLKIEQPASALWAL